MQVKLTVDKEDENHCFCCIRTSREIFNCFLLQQLRKLQAIMSICLGLRWKYICNCRRILGKYRNYFLQTIHIKFDQVMIIMHNYPVYWCFTPLYADKSYIHCNHQSLFSYVKKVQVPINRRNNKGRHKYYFQSTVEMLCLSSSSERGCQANLSSSMVINEY
jgi:hypothetical protein